MSWTLKSTRSVFSPKNILCQVGLNTLSAFQHTKSRPKVYLNVMLGMYGCLWSIGWKEWIWQVRYFHAMFHYHIFEFNKLDMHVKNLEMSTISTGKFLIFVMNMFSKVVLTKAGSLNGSKWSSRLPCPQLISQSTEGHVQYLLGE